MNANDTTPASTPAKALPVKAVATKPTAKKPAATKTTIKTPAAKVVTPKAPVANETVRTSHATCTHESKGSAGKKARAACRKDRVAAEAKSVKA